MDGDASGGYRTCMDKPRTDKPLNAPRERPTLVPILIVVAVLVVVVAIYLLPALF